MVYTDGINLYDDTVFLIEHGGDGQPLVNMGTWDSPNYVAVSPTAIAGAAEPDSHYYSQFNVLLGENISGYVPLSREEFMSNYQRMGGSDDYDGYAMDYLETPAQKAAHTNAYNDATQYSFVDKAFEVGTIATLGAIAGAGIAGELTAGTATAAAPATTMSDASGFVITDVGGVPLDVGLDASAAVPDALESGTPFQFADDMVQGTTELDSSAPFQFSDGAPVTDTSSATLGTSANVPAATGGAASLVGAAGLDMAAITTAAKKAQGIIAQLTGKNTPSIAPQAGAPAAPSATGGLALDFGPAIKALWPVGLAVLAVKML